MDDRPRMLRRALARAIDLLPFALLAATANPLAYVAGVVWILVADAVLPGVRSPGKRLLGLAVDWLDPQGAYRRPDLRESALRNLPLAIPAVLGIHPIGWILLPFVGLPLLGAEVYLGALDPDGRRLGDRLAGTQVVRAPGLPSDAPAQKAAAS